MSTDPNCYVYFSPVREPEGGLKLYCKGADIVVLERLQKDSPHQERIESALEVNWSFDWTISVYCCWDDFLYHTIRNFWFQF